MKIESIVIVNFRQFYQTVKLEFSTDEDKNITVVHGANGSGKTSLLNAFKWCFYGTTDFDTGNDSILNESAILENKDEDAIEVSVTLQFLHEDERYYARRTQQYRKTDGINVVELGQSEFVIDVTGKDGQTKRSNAPDAQLQQILPRDLHPYFFFNGERIEHLAGVNQSALIRDAIRKLMGLELVDRAVVHVGKVEAKYNREARSDVSEEYSDLLQQTETLKSDIQGLEENVTSMKRSEESHSRDAQYAETQLRKHSTSIKLQARRKLLETQIGELTSQANSLRARQRQLIGKNAHVIAARGLFEKSRVLIEENRKKGVLPYGINAQFIDDRISLGACICGAELTEGSEQHRHLLVVRETAGTEQQETAYTTVSGLLRALPEAEIKFKDDYQTTTSSLKQCTGKISDLDIENNNIGAQLVNSDNTVISKLESARSKAASIMQSTRDERKIAERDITEKEKKLEVLRKDKVRMEDRESQINSAQKRMNKCDELGGVLKELRDSLSDQVRNELSKKVDGTFQSIIRKPVHAVIDEDYSLKVVKAIDSGVDLQVNEQSTGERQVTSLSFISSIIALAKEKHKPETKNPFFHGGLYPLVMDSPFGSLDDDYREKVAANVTVLAEQVIIFVSNSQWNGKVKDACQYKVGKSYQLVYHTPKVASEDEDSYLVQSKNGYEYSTIMEVTK